MTDCPVLHEDRQLIIIAKPQGLLSHPNPGTPEPAAFQGDFDPAERCFHLGRQRTWLIHRLDQDTSGVLLAAKDASSADTLREAFASGQVRKRYLALVASSGGLKPQGQWLDHLTVQHQRDRVRTVVKIGMKPNAELRYRVVSYSAEHHVTLIEIDLITGKTHQIRVQAASRRHGLVGDDIYGDFAMNRQLRSLLGTKRLFLHAHQLSLPHPSTKAKLTITAEPDWQENLAKLAITPQK
jgi:RluA family pseudouridine synthase